MVSILQLSESPYIPVQPMFKAKLRHGIPGDPELGQYAVNEPGDHEPRFGKQTWWERGEQFLKLLSHGE